MGDAYSVISCGKLTPDERASIEHDYGIRLPTGSGRYPTLREIRTAIQFLQLTARFEEGVGSWTAMVDRSDGAWVSIYVPKYSGNEDQPHDFYFERGYQELAVRILEVLSRTCGAFLMTSHFEGVPQIIQFQEK